MAAPAHNACVSAVHNGAALHNGAAPVTVPNGSLAPPPLRRQCNVGWYFQPMVDIDVDVYLQLLCASYKISTSPRYMALPLPIREFLTTVRHHLPALRSRPITHAELNTQTYTGHFPNLRTCQTENIVQLDQTYFWAVEVTLPNLQVLLPHILAPANVNPQPLLQEPRWALFVPVDSYLQLDFQQLPRVLMFQ